MNEITYFTLTAVTVAAAMSVFVYLIWHVL